MDTCLIIARHGQMIGLLKLSLDPEPSFAYQGEKHLPMLPAQVRYQVDAWLIERCKEHRLPKIWTHADFPKEDRRRWNGRKRKMDTTPHPTRA